jgi:geranylgeranyl pyrophosphate synthase
LDRHASLEYARGKALEYAGRAAQRLESLPPSPAREMLAAMAHFAVSRSQ